MTDDKPDLYSIQRALIENYPRQTVEQFTIDIKKGLSPSTALNNFVRTNACSELDSSVILELLKQAYDDIDISQISGPLHDSGYPFGVAIAISDEEFDKMVAQAYEHPSKW